MVTRTICLLPASLCLLCCGRSARSYVDKGNTLFAEGKIAEAEINYRKALQKDPKDGEAYHRLGMAALKQGDLGGAYQALSLAVQLMPESQTAKVDLVSFALSMYLQDPRRPKVLYDALNKLSNELLQKDGRSYAALRAKAYLALVEHRAEAEALFRRANEAMPGQQDVIAGLMDALIQQNRAADAEKLGLDSISAGKKAGSAYDALYRLYVSTNRPAEAEKILIRKTRDNPTERAYILQLANYYARAGKTSQMTSALQLFNNPTAFPRAHLDAGDLYLTIGDRPKALEQYSAGAAANPKDRSLYEGRIARVLVLQNKRDEAIQVLDGLIKANPDNAEARMLRAVSLVENPMAAKPNEGIDEFQTLVDKNPQDVSLRFLFSTALLERGNLAAARLQLIEVTKRSPGFLLARMSLAEISLRQGQLSETLQNAEAALNLDPTNVRAQFIRGSALLGLGNLAQAHTIFTSLLLQSPKSVDVRLQLALLDSRRKRFAEAEAAYRKILESAPNEWRAIAGLVDNYSAQQRPEKAFALLEAELRKSHGASPIRILLAETAVKERQYNTAIEQYRQLISENPRAVDPPLQLAKVLDLKGDVGGAIATLQKASAARPKEVRPKAMLAGLFQQTHRNQEANEQLRLALAIQPDDVLLMNNLAFLLADTGGSLDEALKLARQASGKAPNEPGFADTLGWVYVKKGLNDEAIQILRKLVAEHSDNPMYSYHFGVALCQNGEKTAGRLLLGRALGLHPPQDLKDRIASAQQN